MNKDQNFCSKCQPDGVKPTREDLSIYAERIADKFNNGNLNDAADMLDAIIVMDCWKDQAEASAALAIVALDVHDWLATICDDLNAVDRLIRLLAERARVKP